ncbi:MAG: alpha/beta fold hydrolase [Ignavibacteriaceae bacterium]
MNKAKSNLAIYTSGDNRNIPIIFVHGFPYDHEMWNMQVMAMSSKFFCVTYDIRGLGSSPAGDGQFTMESFVDDLENILFELNLNKPVLCGLSMGGYISLRAIERMEEKFSALILCDTKSEADSNEAKLKRAEGVKQINSEGLELFVKGTVPNTFTFDSIKNSNTYQEILGRSLRSNPLGVKGCLLAMSGRTDTTVYLSQIKIPTLVICGEEDKLSPPASMKDMANKINGAEYVLVPKAAHMSPVENPNFVNKTIEDFIQKNLENSL